MAVFFGSCGCKKRKKDTTKMDVDAITNSPIDDEFIPETEIYVEEFDADKMLCHQCDASC